MKNIHWINKTEEYEKKKQQQEKQIKKLYKKRKEYDITDAPQVNLFKCGYKKHMEQSVTANENWIKLVKMLFASADKRDENEKIPKWLNRNNKYQDTTKHGL